MEKYERMLEKNQMRNASKVRVALDAIGQLESRKEPIAVVRLADMTGFSRGFFYKNPQVSKALQEAKKRQGEASVYLGRKRVLDHAQAKEILRLKKVVAEKEAEVIRLQQEKEILEKALKKRNLELFEQL